MLAAIKEKELLIHATTGIPQKHIAQSKPGEVYGLMTPVM
jgi:hypothetical protein